MYIPRYCKYAKEKTTANISGVFLLWTVCLFFFSSWLMFIYYTFYFIFQLRCYVVPNFKLSNTSTVVLKILSWKSKQDFTIWMIRIEWGQTLCMKFELLEGNAWNFQKAEKFRQFVETIVFMNWLVDKF